MIIKKEWDRTPDTFGCLFNYSDKPAEMVYVSFEDSDLDVLDKVLKELNEVGMRENCMVFSAFVRKLDSTVKSAFGIDAEAELFRRWYLRDHPGHVFQAFTGSSCRIC